MKERVEFLISISSPRVRSPIIGSDRLYISFLFFLQLLNAVKQRIIRTRRRGRGYNGAAIPPRSDPTCPVFIAGDRRKVLRRCTRGQYAYRVQRVINKAREKRDFSAVIELLGSTWRSVAGTWQVIGPRTTVLRSIFRRLVSLPTIPHHPIITRPPSMRPIAERRNRYHEKLFPWRIFFPGKKE